MPERSWRRWQVRARQGHQPKGPWPRPVRDAAREPVVRHALARPVWGHREVWVLCREGRRVWQVTVLRLLRDDGLIGPVGYQKQRRGVCQGPQGRVRGAPTGPIPGCGSLGFSEFETTQGPT